MLAGIEQEYKDKAVAVVGVHSPKFPREGDPEAVRDAVMRNDVSHPVVIDTEHDIWQQYGVRAWPTIVVVDPEGYVHASGSGEPDAAALGDVIDALLIKHASKGTLTERRLPIAPEEGTQGQLQYPTKVEYDRGYIALTDSGHHRVVLATFKDQKFRIAKIVGGPEPGLDDGFPESVRFRHPYGTAFAGEDLYVADTGNHSLRRINLNSGESFTVAGSGSMGRGISDGGSAFDVELRSPWDLAWDESRQVLYVAMAGSHQIWVFDPVQQRIEPFAGSGREARLDGGPTEAAFAQPSGICIMGDKLYVADSEVSAVREVDIETRVTRTVCGGDLFDFGDRDGAGDRARLQHVMGITCGPSGVFIADSYNHKIKKVDPATGECATVYGGADLLNEPEGLALLEDGSFLIADTNNHRLIQATGDAQAIVFE